MALEEGKLESSLYKISLDLIGKHNPKALVYSNGNIEY